MLVVTSPRRANDGPAGTVREQGLYGLPGTPIYLGICKDDVAGSGAEWRCTPPSVALRSLPVLDSSRITTTTIDRSIDVVGGALPKLAQHSAGHMIDRWSCVSCRIPRPPRVAARRTVRARTHGGAHLRVRPQTTAPVRSVKLRSVKLRDADIDGALPAAARLLRRGARH